MTSLLLTARREARAYWPWFVPFVIAASIYVTHGLYVERALIGLLAMTLVLLASRRPDRSLLILIVGLPFQGLVLAQLFAWGLPAQIVRSLSGWKEALALGVVVAGIRGYRTSDRRLDHLDLLGFAYVAIVGAYGLFPDLFAPGAPTAANARSLALRSTVGFVVLLLAARHARLPADFATRAARVVMIVGAVVAAVAVYEYLFSASWNSFVVERVQYPRYQLQILKTTPYDLGDIRTYGLIGGRRITRVGSVFLDPLACGFFLVLPFAVAIERRLRPEKQRGTSALLLLIGAALLLTQTRAALLGGLAVIFLASRPAAGRSSKRRVQFTFFLAAGLIIALPAAATTGLSERVRTTGSGEEQSSIDHVSSFWNGVDEIRAKPLGHGLGTSAGVGQRFDAQRATITENNYLQVGIETGVIAMAAFVALTLALIRRLNRAVRTVADVGVSAARSASIGLALGAFLLHTWNDVAVAWVFWGVAGACLGIAEVAEQQVDDSAEPLVVDRARS